MILALVLIYVAVCLGGHFVVAVILYGMRRLALKHRPQFWDWSVLFIGATERAIALTLVLWVPPYLPAFVGGWVALKFALGWQREKKSDEVLTGSMLALLGNVLSFAIAILVGAYINPKAVEVWAKPH